MQNESAYDLPTQSSLSFHLRTRILPSALYLAAAVVLLAVAKMICV